MVDPALGKSVSMPESNGIVESGDDLLIVVVVPTPRALPNGQPIEVQDVDFPDDGSITEVASKRE